MKYSLFFCILYFFACYASEDEIFHRIQSHLIIEDYNSAKEEAEKYLLINPDSNKVLKIYAKAVAASNNDQLALKVLNQIKKDSPDENIRDIIEEIGWSILKKGVQSSQYSLRLAALIGAYSTKDAKALPIILTGLNDSHCLIRSIAVQLACEFSDQPLKNKILELFDKEKIWLVRLELIKAVGKMRLIEKEKSLRALLQDERTTFEEKQATIYSLIALHDNFSFQEIQKLSSSLKAHLRCLACDITIYFQKKNTKSIILPLLKDSRSDVKIAAMKVLGHLFISEISKEDILNCLKDAIDDPDPLVNITAAWVIMLKDVKAGMSIIEKWLNNNNKRYQIYAAAALASSGYNSIKYMKKFMLKSDNIFVRANLAIGLIGLNKEVRKSCNELFNFLKLEKSYLMLTSDNNLPFHILEPSRIRHIDQIPNYPEAVDQMTKLSLLSLLAMMEDSRAKPAISQYLSEKKWGITGLAAATLLKEGDENSLGIIRELLEDLNPKVRLQASLVLALYGKEESAIPHLEQSYDEVDHGTKLYILEALGHIGNETVIPFLLNVLNEPFMMRRVTAAAAILQSLYH
jgi:HEAT repeat protein